MIRLLMFIKELSWTTNVQFSNTRASNEFCEARSLCGPLIVAIHTEAATQIWNMRQSEVDDFSLLQTLAFLKLPTGQAWSGSSSEILFPKRNFLRANFSHLEVHATFTSQLLHIMTKSILS